MTDQADVAARHGFRIMHTMLRVRDLERSLDFYTRVLGMRLLFRQDYPEGRFTLAFVGYGEHWWESAIELTHNWNQAEPYTHGSGYGHVALDVADVHEACAMLAREGVKVPRPPGPMKHGTINIAFIEDPDGYRIELVQRPS
jgi:lactoylglutathione lyase